MNIDRFEIWVHDHVLKNEKIRHFLYGLYQRVLYFLSPKIRMEGDISIITPNDGYEYLFGYYDKCPWSEDGKYLLALRVKNASKEADSSKPADIVRIDIDQKRVEKIATTHSWNVQQGCMAQWLSNDSILYNDFRNEKNCSVILNLENNTERILDMPVYALSPDKTTILSLDFSRLHRLRPGYGYCNVIESTRGEKCPDKACIWSMDMTTGKITPVLKYTELASFEPSATMEGAEHKVNHLMISPNGRRFMFLHRWFQKGTKYTRLLTCNIDGTDLYNLADDGFVSHCCWKNDEEILGYLRKNNGGKGYYLLKDKTQEYEICWKQLSMDGHPSFSYDGRYVVTDTYPDRRRIQSLYVMDGKRVVRLARVFSPFKYVGDTRCDLHPRWSKNGKEICFDASFDGKRSICIVNTESVVNKNSAGKMSNKEHPLVSVIIPCYNCAEYIDDTLNSVLEQTEKNLEVICVNDGSTDNTEQRIREWIDRNVLDIKFYTQENKGVGAARNLGIKESIGKYILFLDSDDMLHDKLIQGLLYAVEEKQSETAFCSLTRSIEDLSAFVDVESDFVKLSQKEAMELLLYQMGRISFANFIYDRAILLQHNIWFDVHTKYGEDREFIWKYLCHCSNVRYCEKPMYYYRVNKESATRKAASWSKTDLLLAVKRIEKYLEDQNCGFSTEFNSYMYARAMWAVAKAFAVSNDKVLFKRFTKEYNARKSMKTTAKDRNMLVRVASIAYLLNPTLFYKIVQLKKN